MISPTNTISPEWQNENALRAYPILDDAPAATVVPTWLVSDLRITVDVGYKYVFLSSVYVSGTIVSVGISGCRTHKDGTTEITLPPEGLLTCTVTRDELEPFRAYSMTRMFGSASGSIAFGEPPPNAAPFKMCFSPDESPLAASAVIRAVQPGVTQISDAEHGIVADGIIDLSGNDEFHTYVDPDDATGQTIVIALADMYRDLTTSICDASPSFNSCGQIPVKTVSGVSADSTGKLTLLFR